MNDSNERTYTIEENAADEIARWRMAAEIEQRIRDSLPYIAQPGVQRAVETWRFRLEYLERYDGQGID